MKDMTIAIVGMGYVGLPLAVEFSKKYKVIGYDIDKDVIDSCTKSDRDIKDVSHEKINSSYVKFTTNEKDLNKADVVIITVPTPVGKDKLPDLSYIKNATEIVGRNFKIGTIIVYESTVFPGTTNNICVPILEKESGYVRGKDFEVGYSPERINVNDELHTLKNIVKIVASDDEECRSILCQLYGSIIENIYKCDAIAVAEGAKMVENCQRDLNIAFMNEMLIIFKAMNIDFYDVLSAASTKWNFINCTPGLVGGHCIGVDSYYMLYKAEKLGSDMPLLKAGRSINENMVQVYFLKMKEVISSIKIDNIKIAFFGGTFKEDCSDIRNSKNLELFELLKTEFKNVVLVDPYIKDNNIAITDMKDVTNINVLIIGAGHKIFENFFETDMNEMFNQNSEKYIFDFSLFLKRKNFNRSQYRYITFCNTERLLGDVYDGYD